MLITVILLLLLLLMLPVTSTVTVKNVVSLTNNTRIYVVFYATIVITFPFSRKGKH